MPMILSKAVQCIAEEGGATVKTFSYIITDCLDEVTLGD